MSMENIKVKYHNGYLQAFMPNGDLMPAQTDIKIENSTDQKNMVTVSVSFEVPISNINNEEENPLMNKKIEDLLKEKESILKASNFWEREYNLEYSKKWYHKVFGSDQQKSYWWGYWSGYYQKSTK